MQTTRRIRSSFGAFCLVAACALISVALAGCLGPNIKGIDVDSVFEEMLTCDLAEFTAR